MKTKFLQRVVWLMIPLLTIFTTNVYGAEVALTQTEIQAATAQASYPSSEVNVSSASGTWHGKMVINTATGFVQIRKNAANNYCGSPTFSGAVTKVVITTCNSTAADASIYLRANNQTAQPSSGDYGSGTTGVVNGTVTINVTGSPTSFYIYSSKAVYISSITVTYSDGGGGGGAVSDGDKFSRIASVSDLSDGDKIIFVDQNETHACSTTQNTNNRGVVSITTSSHIYTYASSDNVQVFTVKISTSNTSYYGFHTGDGYIASKDGAQNRIETNSTSASTNPSGAFAWTLSASSNVFTCLNVQNNTYYLAFNGTSYFSKYASSMTKPYIYKKVAVASCTADPTVGNPTIPTSFTLTSLTGAVSVNGSCNPGSNCSWTDMGLVWSDGTATTTPTTSNNKKVIDSSGSTTSFANNIQPSGSTTPTAWVVGHTYYVREYGKNGKAGATYHYSTNAASFTLRSITFNSNGGSSVGTIYCNSGGTATQPTAPTNGNYTFDGWYTDAGLTTPVNWSSTISENKTYYAKWSCSKHITVSWSAPSHGSIVVHQGNNADGPVLSSGAVLDNCEQAQIYVVCTPNDGYGVSSFSATNSQAHTGTTNILTFYTVNTTASSTITVTFAPVYTVTWMVNGSSYTTGGPTTQLSEGQHVTTLPTAPDPASYCGEVFVGWTDEEYSGDSAPTHLYKTASEFPNATSNQVFYAVFADYDD